MSIHAPMATWAAPAFAIVSKTITNMGVQISVHNTAFSSFGCVHGREIAGSCGHSMLNSLGEVLCGFQ